MHLKSKKYKPGTAGLHIWNCDKENPHHTRPMSVFPNFLGILKTAPQATITGQVFHVPTSYVVIHKVQSGNCTALD